MDDYTIPADVQQVLASYSERFKASAGDDASGLTIFDHHGERYLFPTRTHAAWCAMQHAATATEAERIAEKFLASQQAG